MSRIFVPWCSLNCLPVVALGSVAAAVVVAVVVQGSYQEVLGVGALEEFLVHHCGFLDYQGSSVDPMYKSIFKYRFLPKRMPPLS